MNKPFRPSKYILEDRSIEELEAIEEERYEDKLVNYLFQKYNLDQSIKFEMLNEQREEHGFRRLTLESFHEKFPTFPIYLFARKIRKLSHDSPLHRWFSDFARRAFTRKWVELFDTEVPTEWCGPVGLIFHLPYLHGQILTQGKYVKKEPKGGLGLVIHNRRTDLISPGVRFFWRSPDKKWTLTVEPLSVLLDGMDRTRGRKWCP